MQFPSQLENGTILAAGAIRPAKFEPEAVSESARLVFLQEPRGIYNATPVALASGRGKEDRG